MRPFTKPQLNLARKIRDEGGRRISISKALNISDRRAKQILAILDAEDPPKNLGKLATLTPYQVAMEDEVGLQAAKSKVAKAKGEYYPAEEELRSMSYNGVLYKDLCHKFGFKHLDETVDALEAAFPDCYVVRTKNALGDVILTPIIQTRDIPSPIHQGKLFKYSVSHGYLHVKFNDDIPGSVLNLFNFTDVHKGAKSHRKSLLAACVDLVAESPNHFWFDGGDTLEFNHRRSAGDPQEQIQTNTEQYMDALEHFGTIAYKGLFKVDGNHEGGRSVKEVQFDVAHAIAYGLHMPYFSGRVLVDYEWRGNMWTHMATHKWDGAIQRHDIIKKVRGVLGQFQGVKFDWFTSGHTHDAFIEPMYSNTRNPGSLAKIDTLVVNGGSFVSQSDTYAEQWTPTPQDFTYLILREDGEREAGAVRIPPT